MCMVTDIEDLGDELRIFVPSDMARLAAHDSPDAIDVARHFSVKDPKDMDHVKRRLTLNDAD